MNNTQETAQEMTQTTCRTPAEFYARLDECMANRLQALLEARGELKPQDNQPESKQQDEKYKKGHPGYSPRYDLLFLGTFCLLHRRFRQQPLDPDAMNKEWSRARRLLQTVVMKGCFDRGELDEFVGVSWE